MQNIVQPLLTATHLRSDDISSGGPSYANELPAPPVVSYVTVCIESLTPRVRGHVLDVMPTQTVAALKAQYIATLRHEAVILATTQCVDDAYEEHLRIIFDGVELEDGQTLDECGVCNNARLCALSLRVPRAIGWRIRRVLFRWWPVWVAFLFFSGLFLDLEFPPISEKTGAVHKCNSPQLMVFIGVSFPLLLIYFFVASGMFQDDRGRRLLWFLRLHLAAGFAALAVVIFALVWFVLGSSWLFGPNQGCRLGAPNVFYTALCTWLLLLAVNLPWLMLVLLPLLLLCRSPLAFAMIARLSGVHGGAMQR